MAGLPPGVVRDKKTARPGRRTFRASEGLLEAILQVESGMDPNAVSPKGAQGLAQIMPDTAADPGYGVDPVKDPFDPKEARRFARQYYDAMLAKYDGDHELALMAYNSGPGTVDKWVKRGRPPEAVSKETRDYVNNLLPVAQEQAQAPDPAAARGSLPPGVVRDKRAGRRGTAPPKELGGLAGLISGEGRTEFPDMPELLSYSEGLPAASPERAQVWAGASTAVDTEALADIAMKALQGATRKEDKQGNVIITYEGKDYMVNQPGASQTDLVQLIGQTGWFSPGTRLASGMRTLGGRMAASAPLMAGTSAATDIAAGALGSEQGVSGERALTAGALGPVAEIAAPAVAGVWRMLTTRRDLFNPLTKQLTEKGKDYVRKIGLDPDDLTPGVQGKFAREMATEQIPDIAMSKALSKEFDIPYTRGQTVQSASQSGREEQIRHGVYGSRAQEIMGEFDQLADQRVEAALQRVQNRLGGAGISKPSEAGDVVSQGLRREAATFDRAIDDAYEYARGLDAHVDASALPRLRQWMTEGLDQFSMTPDLYPAATRAVKIVDDLVNKAKAIKPSRARQETTRGYLVIDAPGRGPQNISVADLDLARKRLVNSIGLAKTQADRKAAGIVKKSFDRWEADVVENGLFSGDQAAIPALRKAIQTRARKGYLLGPRLKKGKGDDVGTMIQRIIDEDRTGSEVANWIIGSAKIGSAQSQKAIRVARRLEEIFGRDSVEYGVIREGVFNKLSVDAAGKTVSPRVFVQNMKQAFHKAPELMKELFREEQKLLSSLRTAIERRVVPESMTNPSRSAFTAMRAVRDSVRRIGTQLTFRGHALKAWPVFLLGRALPERAGSQAAIRSISPVRSPVGRAPAFTSTGQAGERLLDPELRPSVEREIERQWPGGIAADRN